MTTQENLFLGADFATQASRKAGAKKYLGQKSILPFGCSTLQLLLAKELKP